MLKKIASTLFSKVAKPVQKALKSGTEHVGKEIGEISGDYIMKKLSRSKKQTGSNAHVILKRLRQEFFSNIIYNFKFPLKRYVTKKCDGSFSVR